MKYAASVFLITLHLLQGHGIIDEEIATITKELHQSPKDVSLLMRRAQLHQAHQDYPKALADLKTALAISPKAPLPLLALAKLERAHHKPELAKVAIDHYLKLTGEKPLPEALKESALISTDLHQHRDASSAWRQFLKSTNSASSNDYLTGAMAHLAAEKKPGMLVILKEGLEKFPASIPLRQGLVEYFVTCRELNRAYTENTRLLEAYPTLQHRLLYQEGLLWQRYHHQERAQTAFRKAQAAISLLSPRVRNQEGIQTLSKELHSLIIP